MRVAKTTVGHLLEQALRAKTAELGEEYSYRDLERDSGVNFSYASKVIRGGLKPSSAVIKAWARALYPHFPEDQAMLAAGHVPDNAMIQRMLDRLVAWPRDRWGDLEARIGEWGERYIAQDDPDQQAGEEEPDHQTAKPPPPNERHRSHR